MKMTQQQYCLRWKHHHSNVQNMFSQLLEKERFCDVTLYCSPSFQGKDAVDQNLRGVSLRAHRVVLAACSELLGSLLGAHDGHPEPVLVVDGCEPRHLQALLRYMYTGEMSVHHSQLAGLLKTAEELRIKGLTDIRWNNKDEPPDCNAGNLGITTTPAQKSPETKSEAKTPDPKPESKPEPKSTAPMKSYEAKNKRVEAKADEGKTRSKRVEARDEASTCDPAIVSDVLCPELRAYMKKEPDDERMDTFGVNGGPPPLIKLVGKSPPKREFESVDSPSPKRKRLVSGESERTDDDNSRDKDQDWQHGNMDISAKRVATWGEDQSSRDPIGSGSEDEWADTPADIGSFLHTRLRVDGDNSADEDSNEGSLHSSVRSLPSGALFGDTKGDAYAAAAAALSKQSAGKPGGGGGGSDPRFSDVVKLNDYLQHGRRPQFWEENYVKRVMEAVRLKQLEMKQAAEILGVSYGTLYGRYRDVYGCINRPYREGQGHYVYCSNTRDFWQAKGPSEVLERLQRGEITMETASQALGVTATNLAAYVADSAPADTDFEPIPIEVDPSLKLKARAVLPAVKLRPKTADKSGRRAAGGGAEDEDSAPLSMVRPEPGAGGKWPSIRVANIESLRAEPQASPASPSALMRTRPDLTIVAATRRDRAEDTS